MILNPHKKIKQYKYHCVCSVTHNCRKWVLNTLWYFLMFLCITVTVRDQNLFLLSPEKNPTRANPISAKFVSNINPINEATDECSSKMQGIKTSFLQKSQSLLRQHPYSLRHIDWPVPSWILQNVCSFRGFFFYQHLKNKESQKLTHCPFSYTPSSAQKNPP